MITMTDAEQICPALNGRIFGACGLPMAPWVTRTDRYVYLCPPECGHDQADVIQTDDAVFGKVAARHGWTPGFCSHNRPKKRDLIVANVAWVDVLPDGTVSIEYQFTT